MQRKRREQLRLFFCSISKAMPLVCYRPRNVGDDEMVVGLVDVQSIAVGRLGYNETTRNGARGF